MVVVLIIGILAAIATPIFLGALDRSRAGALQAAMVNARIAVAVVVVETGSLPTLAEQAAIFAQDGDPEITLTLRGATADFCLEGSHTQLTRTWASTDQIGPTEGAGCAADGTIILP